LNKKEKNIMLKKMLMKVIIIITALLIVAACSTPNPCPDNPAIGNVGSMLNTGNDDYLPMIDGDRIYFTSIREDGNSKDRLYFSDIQNDEFTMPVKDTTLPLDYLDNSGSPCFATDPITGHKIIYFAAISLEGRANRDIFTSEHDGKKWGVPYPLDRSINTEHYESHPAVSPDGSFIVFSSDRPGGYGETDLYISFKRGSGWTEPENLGPEINTDQQEISPYINPNGNLLYSSKGFSGGKNYDIIKTRKVSHGKWAASEPYPFPINTEFDETGPTVWRDKLFLSSERRGGCGGFDLYRFDYCGPIYLHGQVYADNNLPKKGKLELTYEQAGRLELSNKEEQIIVPVDNDGSYMMILQPFQDYIIKYSNPCIPEFDFVKRFTAPCSDTTTVKMILDVPMPDKFTDFTFEHYNVPFFVSGYYMPNTINNLEALRLKFNYNMIGNDDSTTYIENPGNEYDQYTDDVERALDDAVNFILNKIEFLQGECARGDEVLTISVIGFADPRPISGNAKYNGSSIHDLSFGLKVDRGARMDNELLSLLRAYYTARHLHNILRQNNEYRNMEGRLLWKISGKGVDERDTLTDELKRRVYIKINID
jgi:hypothetical protein